MKRVPDTEGKENARVVPFFPGAVTIRRDPVEPVPVGTHVAMVFRVTGYDPDCDGSLMARLAHVDESGDESGWEPTHLGLYPTTDIVLDDPGELFRLADEQANHEPGYHGTMKMSRTDADEIASWAKEQVVRERMALLEGIVRDLAAMPVDGGEGYCGFCAARLDGREHLPACLYRRARDLAQ